MTLTHDTHDTGTRHTCAEFFAAQMLLMSGQRFRRNLSFHGFPQQCVRFIKELFVLWLMLCNGIGVGVLTADRLTF